MSTEAGIERDGPATGPEGVLAVFGDPLVAALDDEERETRREAARAVCLLAAAEESAVPRLTDRILDRLPDASHGRTFVRTLATLAARHGPAVEEEVRTHGVPRRVRRAVAEADPYSLDVQTDGGSGAAVESAVRRVVESGGSTGVGQRDTRDTERTANGPRGEAAGQHRESERGGDPAAVARRRRIEQVEQSRPFRAIRLESRFEDLRVVEPEQAVRYGSVLRTRAVADGDQRGVALRLFDRPDEEGEPRRAFEASLAETLARWDGVADHEGIAPVHDWGERPRPWLAGEYVEGTLADRSRASVARGLREGAQLAGALAHLHNSGVVHAGIDPRSVVYPDTSLDGLPAPRLDHVGLLNVFRDYFDPASYLDPRFAAPEYFDRQYGTVDQATDVYQLGTVLYRLLTGRPPATGTYETVREKVLDERPPAPTAIDASLPDGVDDVIAKATAKDKLARYETAAALRRDCWRLARAVE
ncbi:MAG: hypothetical protein ABEH35_02230 [Haloarculaceae archaeon]